MGSTGYKTNRQYLDDEVAGLSKTANHCAPRQHRGANGPKSKLTFHTAWGALEAPLLLLGIWRKPMKYGKDNIRVLNDELRTKLTGGVAVMTPGVAALGAVAVARAVRAIGLYQNFIEENDPHNEHDFGAIDIEGQKVFFKIDYYSPDLNSGSEDPSDPSVTRRVMTVMLASEY